MKLVVYTLFFIVLINSTLAQQIVFPFEYNGNSMTRFSANGEIIGIVESGTSVLNLVEAQTGHLLASTILDGYDIIQFQPSFTGEFIAIIAYKNDKTDLLFYQYSNVNDLYLLNKISLEDNFIEFSSNLLELVPVFNNDFYLKIRNHNSGPLVKQYQTIIKYVNTGYDAYEEYSIGEVDDHPVDIWDNSLYYLKTNFMAYDFTSDEKYLTILSTKKINSKIQLEGEFSQTPFSFALVEWAMNKKSQTYTHLFMSDVEHIDEEVSVDGKPINYDFADGQFIYSLKYDNQKRRLYGVGYKEALKPILESEIQRINMSNYFSENQIENSPQSFWKEGKFNDMIPFYYSIDSGTFHCIGNVLPDLPFLKTDTSINEKLTNVELDNLISNKSTHLGFPIDHYFSPNSPNLFFVSSIPNNELEYRITRINLLSNEVDHLDILKPCENPAIDFTPDDKLILSNKNLNSASSLQYQVTDLTHMLVSINNKLETKIAKTVAHDVYFTRINEERHLLILVDSNLINFNFSSLPFFTFNPFGYYSPKLYKDYISNNNKILPLAEKTNKTHLDIDKYFIFSFFPEKHHIVSSIDGTRKFVRRVYDPPFTQSRNARPVDSDVFNYVYSNPQEIISMSDTLNGGGYDNLCSKDGGYTWHEHSKKLFVITQNVVEKWDPEKHKAEFVYKNHPTNIHAFDVGFNDSLMVTASLDGKICFWNIFTNKLIADLYLFNGGADWIFILPGNYYYGTKEAVKKIAFAFSLKALPIEYFELKYNRPDLVLKALGSTHPEIVSAFYKAYSKRLQKLNLDEKMLQVDFDIPYLKITNEKLIPIEIDIDSVELNLEMYDHKNSIEKINIFINGVLVQENKIIDAEKQNYVKRKINLKICSGINKIEISITNNKAVESIRQKFQIKGNFNKKPDLYVISIGAGHYSQNEFNLNYAEKDEKDFANLLRESPAFAKTHVLEYSGEKVTNKILEEIKDSLRKSKLEDIVYVYYAGHGILDDKFDYYLGTYNVNFDNPSIDGILYDDFENMLAQIPALQKIILLDACHSGEIEKDEIIEDKSIAIVKEITFRNVGKGVKNKNQLNSSDILKNVFAEMRKGTGATVISSAGGAEYAMESDEWKNGLFTYCLIHGLKDRVADLNNDGNIMLSELQLFLTTEVKKISKGKQQPTSRIENTHLDFKVW